MKIKESKGKLKVGDWVRTNGNGYSAGNFFEGEVGEICDGWFFVWQNEKEGAVGSIHPSTRGYKYSWGIGWSSPGEIEILSKNTMQKLTSTLKRILSPELQVHRKLYKAGLIDGNLELTDEGKNEIWALLLKQFEAELVKVAEEKLAEEEKK